PRHILEWIDDPAAARIEFDEASWNAFTAQLRDKYKVDPEKDGPGIAARKLGEAKVGSHWDGVWNRFAEAPARYPRIPQMLRGAKPATPVMRGLFDAEDAAIHWPQDNEEGENE